MTLIVLQAAGIRQKPFAIAMFCCAAFVAWRVSARSSSAGCAHAAAMASRGTPRRADRAREAQSRRYGGYIVHIGIAVLFVGVAASSSFQRASELGLSPGQSARVGAYTIRYVRPTASVTPDYDSPSTQGGAN